MRNLPRILALVLLAVNGAGAIYGGYLLMTDPTGHALQMPHEWIEHTPFKDFFVPGVILFLVNGICSFIVIIATIVQYRKAAALIFVQGLLLCGWIFLQLLLTLKYHPLQAIMGAIGLLLMITGYQLTHRDTIVAQAD
ncbi:hypothetical protein I5907_17230 [Panacibacter sp. DH6]|uniref:Uncharacterized protein n=1 Tax=Panacibacter microcysteis TaxID=2793269 RepID=A0A931GZ18_9BACT|nr:hypothetical protein [Panacibacter microcysteis]MBG9377985.1 hypothetical protein [Panacibacter microcysteis]